MGLEFSGIGMYRGRIRVLPSKRRGLLLEKKMVISSITVRIKLFWIIFNSNTKLKDYYLAIKVIGNKYCTDYVVIDISNWNLCFDVSQKIDFFFPMKQKAESNARLLF